jgi:hypothetical protein
MNVMHLIQNLKRKSIAGKSMILLAAITLSTVVATDDALAAGHGDGAPGASGGVGGGHTGGELSGGPIGRGFGGNGFAGGRLGAGIIDGRMAGDHLGGRGRRSSATAVGATLRAPSGAASTTDIITSTNASSVCPAITMTTMVMAWTITPTTTRAFSIGTFTPPPARSGVRSGFATELACAFGPGPETHLI